MREQLKEFTKQYEKSENDLKALQSVGQVTNMLVRVIRFIGASIYRNTFPTIRIAILLFYNHNFFFSYNDFHLDRKDTFNNIYILHAIFAK